MRESRRNAFLAILVLAFIFNYCSDISTAPPDNEEPPRDTLPDSIVPGGPYLVATNINLQSIHRGTVYHSNVFFTIVNAGDSNAYGINIDAEFTFRDGSLKSFVYNSDRDVYVPDSVLSCNGDGTETRITYIYTYPATSVNIDTITYDYSGGNNCE